ncbi:LysR substrate-binding domain-containing protein [Oceanimonas pelagia]|uniref:LysR substrate-binding domain-containing protein n=1 Tax=Oceanimonas pelagia TaxID=3028314 RepID=A0AA50KMT4_9GAMM|nr:LysR substrate-binding domain-containing protein [Oceanimonas pelagia]WMC09845.1 LysR substrate-binding domain-containing protein [Oceanimonas pelagia]
MKRWGTRGGLLPTLNNLIALEAIARLGSFRAAADEMSLTQGAVAQQVRMLEEELGCSLFERLPRGVTPTREAREYINRLRFALDIIDEATRALLEQGSTEDADRLTVSTTPTFASHWLIPRLPGFAGSNPSTSVMIDASEAIRPLRGKGSVDMTIRWGAPPFAEGVAQFLLPGNLIPVCSPGLVEYKAVSRPEELARLPLISDSHNRWKKWLEIYGISGVKPSGPVFSQTSHAIEAAIQGMGVALVPLVFVEVALRSGVLVNLLGNQYGLNSDIGFYIITAAPVLPESPCDILIDWLLAEASSFSSEEKHPLHPESLQV